MGLLPVVWAENWMEKNTGDKAMKCTDCQSFQIRQQPIEGFDLGLAECRKHNLVVDFRAMRKVKNNGQE